MPPETQEELAAAPHVTDGRTQPVKHESSPSQNATWPPSHDDDRAQGLSAVTKKLDDKPVKQETHMLVTAAGSDDIGMADGSSAVQNSSGADIVLGHTLEPNGKHEMPTVSVPPIENENHMDSDLDPSVDLNVKNEAMLKAFDQLTDEEAAIEQRRGTPSAKPIDKSRLSIVKQELQRITEALDKKEILDIDIAAELKVAQNAIGVPISALRTSSSVKPTSSTKKSRNSTKKRRKEEGGDTGSSSKKRKLNQAPENQVRDADTISKILFDQLAGRDMAACGRKSLKETLPSLRGLGKARSGELKKIKAAAKKIATKETKALIEADIHAIFSMTRPFGKSCRLKLLQGDEDSEEEKNIDDYAWEIEGMASALCHHQLLAAGYMCIMERSDTCGGGLLFDYMGYGKTVESLALVVGNKPSDVSKNARDSGAATTLVVVPTAAAQQWADEVRLHCPGLEVAGWTDHFSMKILLAHDILIITYPELRIAYKDAGGVKRRGRKKELKENEEKPEAILDHPLFRAKFHRIILDEMHEIKGYNVVTCDAAMELNAEHKWGLTGTPTPNGIEELFPYLKFIGHEVTTMREFRVKYVGGQSRHGLSEDERFKRLRELLAPVMIMRTPSHSFLGAALLKLPQDHPLPPILVDLSAEERIIYRSFEKSIQEYIAEKIAVDEKEVDAQKMNESFVWLRQCVASPLLLGKPAKDGVWTLSCLAMMRKEARDAGEQSTPHIDQLERWVQRKDAESPHPGSIFLSKSFANAWARLKELTCPGNGCEKTTEQLTEPQVAECGHVWCKACLAKQIKFEKIVEEKETPECSRCHKPLGEAKPYSPAETDGEAAEHTGQDSTPQRRRGEDYNGVQPRLSSKDNVADFSDEDPAAKVPRSAKVDAVIRQIVDWQNEAPEDKIIVFIQWVGLNGVLGRLLQEEGIEFLYYTSLAGMKEEERKAAIQTFREDPYVKVLLCSLRCGGQALNLTCANRTIMVDLWWNQSVEAQATARVYRMGQQKETYSVRIIVRDSVDEKIHALQVQKLKLLKNAFQEFEADKSLDKETLFELLGWQSVEDETLGDENYDDNNNNNIDHDSDDDSDASYKPGKA